MSHGILVIPEIREYSYQKCSAFSCGQVFRRDKQGNLLKGIDKTNIRRSPFVHFYSIFINKLFIT